MWVFNNNVRLACCEVYGLLHQLRGANAEATRAVLQYCEGSDWNDEMDEDLELAQQEHRRRDSTELILALLLRSRQSHVQPLFSVCLSVMALRAGVGVSYWGLLRRLGLVLNKQFTQRFCRAVSERLREKRMADDVRVRCDTCGWEGPRSMRASHSGECGKSVTSAPPSARMATRTTPATGPSASRPMRRSQAGAPAPRST